MRVKISDGCFRHIPSTRDDARDWREILFDVAISAPFDVVDRERKKRPTRIQRPVKAMRRHEV